MSASSTAGAPPQQVRNSQPVYVEGVYAGATAHVYLNCPRIRGRSEQHRTVKAVQAWIWLRVNWCPACRHYGASS